MLLFFAGGLVGVDKNLLQRVSLITSARHPTTLRNVSKLPFFDKIGQAKSVDFRFYSAI